MPNRSPSKPGFAIIGCGHIGRRRAAALTDARLLYACDIDGARAADLAKTVPGCQPSTDAGTILRDPAVDAIVVATLNAALAPLSLAAVRAGKHVLVEKPGALSAAQLRDVKAAADRSGARVRLRLQPSLSSGPAEGAGTGRRRRRRTSPCFYAVAMAMAAARATTGNGAPTRGCLAVVS